MKQMGRALAVLIVGLALSASEAAAQTPSSVFVSGGLAAVSLRPASQFATPADGPHSLTAAVLLSGGFEVDSWLGIEGAIGLQPARSLVWRFSYSFSSLNLATDRDMPIAVYARLMPSCTSRVCLQLLAGGGLNWYRTRTVMTHDCGRIGASLEPCVPVSNREAFVDSGLEPLLTFGGDIAARVSRRVTLGPTVRFFVIDRRRYMLESTGHRGPDTAGRITLMIGLSATWVSR
jgi:hypothetical protein